MSKEFPIVDIEFLKTLGDYIKFHADAYKYKFNDIPNRIFIAIIAYQYLCTITNKDLTLEEIYDKHPNLGLIGPGNGSLTRILEELFASSKTVKTHAMLHDVFGNFYVDYKEGPGYAYALPIQSSSCIRTLPFVGHISGLILALKPIFHLKNTNIWDKVFKTEPREICGAQRTKFVKNGL